MDQINVQRNYQHYPITSCNYCRYSPRQESCSARYSTSDSIIFPG